jgi:hypothetical protein
MAARVEFGHLAGRASRGGLSGHLPAERHLALTKRPAQRGGELRRTVNLGRERRALVVLALAVFPRDRS